MIYLCIFICLFSPSFDNLIMITKVALDITSSCEHSKSTSYHGSSTPPYPRATSQCGNISPRSSSPENNGSDSWKRQNTMETDKRTTNIHFWQMLVWRSFQESSTEFWEAVRVFKDAKMVHDIYNKPKTPFTTASSNDNSGNSTPQTQETQPPRPPFCEKSKMDSASRLWFPTKLLVRITWTIYQMKANAQTYHF